MQGRAAFTRVSARVTLNFSAGDNSKVFPFFLTCAGGASSTDQQLMPSLKRSREEPPRDSGSGATSGGDGRNGSHSPAEMLFDAESSAASVGVGNFCMDGPPEFVFYFVFRTYPGRPLRAATRCPSPVQRLKGYLTGREGT